MKECIEECEDIHCCEVGRLLGIVRHFRVSNRLFTHRCVNRRFDGYNAIKWNERVRACVDETHMKIFHNRIHGEKSMQ